ncbi:hypothetical protein CRYUN_Cryun21dG0003300 [Craigia yunnanensis]
MGRIQMESHSQVPYPSPQPKPQPQAPAYYCYSPQPHQGIIYPRPQNNVNFVQVPPYQISSQMTSTIPPNGSLQSNASLECPCNVCQCLRHQSKSLIPLALGPPASLIAWKIPPTVSFSEYSSS